MLIPSRNISSCPLQECSRRRLPQSAPGINYFALWKPAILTRQLPPERSKIARGVCLTSAARGDQRLFYKTLVPWTHSLRGALPWSKDRRVYRVQNSRDKVPSPSGLAATGRRHCPAHVGIGGRFSG